MRCATTDELQQLQSDEPHGWARVSRRSSRGGRRCLSNQTVAYSPSYLYGLFPADVTPAPVTVPPPAPDYRPATRSRTRTRTTAYGLTHRVTRRGSLSATCEVFVHGLPARDRDGARSERRTACSASFAQNVTPQHRRGVGYRYRSGDFGFGATDVGHRARPRRGRRLHAAAVGNAARRRSASPWVRRRSRAAAVEFGRRLRARAVYRTAREMRVRLSVQPKLAGEGSYRRGLDYVPGLRSRSSPMGSPRSSMAGSARWDLLRIGRLSPTVNLRFVQTCPRSTPTPATCVCAMRLAACGRSTPSTCTTTTIFAEVPSCRQVCRRVLERNGVRVGLTLWIPVRRVADAARKDVFSRVEIFRILLRRRWLVLVPAVLGLAAGLVASGRLAREVPVGDADSGGAAAHSREVVPRTNTETVADRLNTINDVILSRSRLERIIRDLDLYSQQRREGIMEDVVQRMRGDIKVRVEGKESFRVTYVSDTAKTAQMVTERLASLYIEENLRDQQNLAESTNQFLESQLEDAKRRLLEQEKKLEDYRTATPGSCRRSSRRTCKRFRMRSCSCRRSANRRTARANGACSSSVSWRMPRRSLWSRGRQTGRSPRQEGPAPLTTAQQLEAAQTALDLAKHRYTPDHPDFRRYRARRCRPSEEARRRSQAAAKGNGVQDAVAGGGRAAAPGQRASGAARGHRSPDFFESAGREAAESVDRSTTRRRSNAVPTRESELVELMRDYETLNQSYLEPAQEAGGLQARGKPGAPADRRAIQSARSRIAAAEALQQHAAAGEFSLAGPFGGLALGLALRGVPRVSRLELQIRGRRRARADAAGAGACADADFRARPPDAPTAHV